MSGPRADARPLHARITAAVVEDLERGVRPWSRPWTADAAAAVRRPLRHTGEPYRGINVLLLWLRAGTEGYRSPTWMTFRQALALGGCVRRGERGATVVYADRFSKLEVDAAGEAVERSVLFLKGYTVFNLEQIEGLPQAEPPVEAERSPEARIAAADAFFQAAGVAVRHGGDQAWYAPATDKVQLPPFRCFPDPHDYYATLAHEAVHWTGHASRLDRRFRPAADACAYAREELVAELGAAFLCADLGLALRPRLDHAQYIASWLKVLSGDLRAVVSASAHAQRACDLLHALQPSAGG